jgi:hypothetical protein
MTHAIAIKTLAGCAGLTERRLRQVFSDKVKVTRGSVDLAAALPHLLANAKAKGDRGDLQAARIAKLHAETALRQHELSERRKRLVPVADIKRIWDAAFHALSAAVASADFPQDADGQLRQRALDILRDTCGGVGRVLEMETTNEIETT